MRWLDMWRLRLRALLSPSRVDRDLDDELRDHLDYLTEEHLAAGLPAARAREQALRDFGNVTRLTEESRDARGVSWISNGVRDFVYGARLMRRSPTFAAAAILTLALGIGATTAMFSIVYGVVLRPLPFSDPDRLVSIWTSTTIAGLPRAFVSAANARDWRSANNTLEDIALVRNIGNFNLVGQGEPERLQGALISSNLLSVLGVTPMLGRGFADHEDDRGNDGVVLLSYSLWRNRFASDPSIVGRSILLNGDATTVVGVMGPGFHYPSREFQVWRPLTINPDDYPTRLPFSFLAVARLKPAVSIEQAQADLDVVSAALEREYPGHNKGIRGVLAPLLDDTVRLVRQPLLLLLGAVGALLAIGCVNLANLLLTRAIARRRELALRTALGAGRGRLVMQSMAELMPVLLVGGACGLWVARLVLDAVLPLMPADMPRVESIGIHWPVLLVSLTTLLVIGLLIAIWPALQLMRAEQVTPLADFTRAATQTAARARVRDALVVSQVSATLLLLVGAALLGRSFSALRDIDPGFSTEHVVSAHVAIPRAKYRTDPAVAEFTRRILERFTSMPGVIAAGMVNRLPLAGGTQTGPIEFEGFEPGRGTVESTDLRTATPGYFKAMGIPLVEGRVFTEGDDLNAPLVGLIDEQVARSMFGDASPIGKRFKIQFPGQPWVTIVGVVGRIRHDGLDTDSRPQAYWNYLQRPQDRMALVIKTASASDAMVQSIAGVIRSIDPEQPIYDVRSLDAVVDRSLARRWLQTTMLAVFAGLALLLAAVGVYGVIAYGVTQRAREFGIRLALGAHRRDIVSMIIRQGLFLALIGTAIGLAVATAGAGFIAGLLFNIRPFDPESFGIAVVTLVVVVLFACYLPARRAGRTDPSTALRAE